MKQDGKIQVVGETQCSWTLLSDKFLEGRYQYSRDMMKEEKSTKKNNTSRDVDET